jgi:hypothetical protein
LIKNPKWISFIYLSIFLISFAIYALYSFSVLPDMRITGDEPHYLMITHSLIYDHDLDLRNNYVNEDWRQIGRQDLVDPHVVKMPDGRWLSIHDIGLAIEMIPGYFFGRRIGAVLTTNIMIALFNTLLFFLCYRVTSNIFTSLITVMAVGLSVPVFFYSMQIFPESSAALFILLMIVLILNFEKVNHWRYSVFISLIMAWLPWLHRKYYIFSFFAGIGLFIYLLSNRSKRRISNLLALALPLITSAIFLLTYLKLEYGKFLPAEADSMQAILSGVTPLGIIGIFIDQQFGLLVFSPIYLFIFFGLAILFKKDRKVFWFSTYSLIFLVLPVALSLSASRQFGGWSPPARYLLPAVPFFAIALSVSLSYVRSKIYKLIFYFFTVVSILITIFLIHPSDPMRYLYPSKDGINLFLLDITRYIKINLTNDLPTFWSDKVPILPSTIYFGLGIAFVTLILWFIFVFRPNRLSKNNE